MATQVYYLRKYNKYGKKVNQCDFLKFIALILMIIDHVSLYFMEDNQLLRAIGRSSAPIWFFFVGYFYAHKDGRLLYSLAVLDYIAAVSFNCSDGRLGILFTIIISRYFMQQIDGAKINIYSLILVLAFLILLLPISIRFFEYGTVVILFSLTGFLNKKKSKYFQYVFFLSAVLYVFMQQAVFDFLAQNLIVFISIFMPILYSLFHFKLKETHALPEGSNKAVRFLARNSLFMYFFHVNFFRLIATI